jgi:hypothetical protein
MDKEKRLMTFGACIVGAVVLYMFVTVFVKPVIDNSAFMVSLATFILGYYWGSSKGSQDKNDLMKGGG